MTSPCITLRRLRQSRLALTLVNLNPNLTLTLPPHCPTAYWPPGAVPSPSQ
jgi:hypothetical protein